MRCLPFPGQYAVTNEINVIDFILKSQDTEIYRMNTTHPPPLTPPSSCLPSNSALLTLNIHQSTLSPKFTQIQLLLPKHPHTLLAPTEISHTTPRHNFAYQSTPRTPHMYAITTSRIHITLFIAFNPIRHPRVTESEGFAIAEGSARVGYIERVDGSWEARVHGKVVAVAGAGVGLTGAGVCNVEGFVVRGETEAITLYKPIGYTPNLSCRRLEAIDLGRQVRGRTEGLFVAVGRVCEPNLVVGVVDDHVVYTVERTALKVVEEVF
jgi:hypothetical protein